MNVGDGRWIARDSGIRGAAGQRHAGADVGNSRRVSRYGCVWRASGIRYISILVSDSRWRARDRLVGPGEGIDSNEDGGRGIEDAGIA